MESSVGKVVLRMNAGKTKYKSFNHVSADIQTLDGTSLEEVTDFKYLVALMESSAKDIKPVKQQLGELVINSKRSGNLPCPGNSNTECSLLLFSQCYYPVCSGQRNQPLRSKVAHKLLGVT